MIVLDDKWCETVTPLDFFSQMDAAVLGDDIMESSTDRLKHEAMETEIDSGKLGISSNVRLLTSYLGDLERWVLHTADLWHWWIYHALFLFFIVFFKWTCFLVLSRLLKSKPQTLSPKPDSLSGPVDQQSSQAKQALSSPFNWKSFLYSIKEGRLKTDSSCLAMIEAEQGALFEVIRRALQSLRKNKV